MAAKLLKGQITPCHLLIMCQNVNILMDNMEITKVLYIKLLGVIVD